MDNDTAIKLGCLELRRFYRDLPQIALSRPENFKILEKDIGLQKFFRKSLLHSVKVCTRVSLTALPISCPPHLSVCVCVCVYVCVCVCVCAVVMRDVRDQQLLPGNLICHSSHLRMVQGVY